MASGCVNCGTPIRWMDTFPGDICVNCHRDKMAGASAKEHYEQIMGGFANPERVKRVQELRRSNAAGPRNSKKSYKRKPKNAKEADNA